MPDAEQLYLAEHWRVVHAMRCALPGWLIVLPRRHTTAISQHCPAEAAELGSLLLAVSGAIEEYTGCRKTYVAQFAEADGFEHVHFHVIPRPADLAPELIGPGADRPRHLRLPDPAGIRTAVAVRAQFPRSRHSTADSGPAGLTGPACQTLPLTSDL